MIFLKSRNANLKARFKLIWYFLKYSLLNCKYLPIANLGGFVSPLFIMRLQTTLQFIAAVLSMPFHKNVSSHQEKLFHRRIFTTLYIKNHFRFYLIIYLISRNSVNLHKSKKDVSDLYEVKTKQRNYTGAQLST